MKVPSRNIQIVDYNPSYSEAFKQINKEWIEHYFKMEEMDEKILNHPQKYILDDGGHIAIALLNGEPVGTCALIKSHLKDFDFELGKMGVSPKAQGLGVGFQLGMNVIEKARALGAKNIFIESNTVLQTAINLYKKLGFYEIKGVATPYERCNIILQLDLN